MDQIESHILIILFSICILSVTVHYKDGYRDTYIFSFLYCRSEKYPLCRHKWHTMIENTDNNRPVLRGPNRSAIVFRLNTLEENKLKETHSTSFNKHAKHFITKYRRRQFWMISVLSIHISYPIFMCKKIME